jgi:hypothetical protein
MCALDASFESLYALKAQNLIDFALCDRASYSFWSSKAFVLDWRDYSPDAVRKRDNRGTPAREGTEEVEKAGGEGALELAERSVSQLWDIGFRSAAATGKGLRYRRNN